MIKIEKKLFIKEKLLIVIYLMALKKERALKYEDVYVEAFKKYPTDFQLIGYSEYPDTELMSKKIYDLRKNGLVQIRRKFITITQKGKSHAEKLINSESSFQDKNRNTSALSRDIKNEIDRIINTDAFQLFLNDKKDQIVDTDFFTYLGTTVRTDRSDFAARIKTLEDVVKAVRNVHDYKMLIDLHTYLLEKFNDTINAKLAIGYPRRKHE
jgi:hypothetical protein